MIGLLSIIFVLKFTEPEAEVKLQLGRVKIGGGRLWGVGPHWKTNNPHCKRQGKKLGGRVSTPLGPDSGESIHYDIVSFSLFILQCFHNLFCTIFMYIFIVSVYAACC